MDGLVLRDSGSGLGTRIYALQDADWNTTGLIDTNANMLERFVYDPYGKKTVLNAAGTSIVADAYNWPYLVSAI